MEEDKFEIQIRRHPIFAILFIAAAAGLIGAGLLTELYGLIFLGVMAGILGGLLFMNAAIVVDKDALYLHNLFGFKSRTIAHDGIDRLNVIEGKLSIESGGRRAQLPRPNSKTLHPADLRFFKAAIQKAQSFQNR